MSPNTEENLKTLTEVKDDGALWAAYSYESPAEAEALNKHYEQKYTDLIPQPSRKENN